MHALFEAPVLVCDHNLTATRTSRSVGDGVPALGPRRLDWLAFPAPTQFVRSGADRVADGLRANRPGAARTRDMRSTEGREDSLAPNSNGSAESSFCQSNPGSSSP